MQFVKKSGIEKLWLKFWDKKKYSEYKKGLMQHKSTNHHIESVSAFLGEHNTFTIQKLKEEHTKGSTLSFSHSGNAGDIIYSLPSLKHISESSGLPIALFLKLDQPLELPMGFSHPMGNVMLNRKMAEMLLPLLQQQPYLTQAEILEGQNILVDLDDVRTCGIKLDRGSIARWYCYLTGSAANLSEPWLLVQPDNGYADKIVIARSSRYQNPMIDHQFLEKYENLVFVGIEPEYEELKKLIRNLQWVRTNDFYELAQIIAGCKFFIGNQSFPFSIAEGLKVPRILETYFNAPNVIPEGKQGYDFYFQDHFEFLVEQLNQQA